MFIPSFYMFNYTIDSLASANTQSSAWASAMVRVRVKKTARASANLSPRAWGTASAKSSLKSKATDRN